MEAKELADWFGVHSDVASLRAVICDLNGVLRGKRLPVSAAPKLASGEMRLPLSALCPDVWGSDVSGNPLVFEEGDPDGVCVPIGRGPLRMDWLAAPSAMIPLWMRESDGTPHRGDPRRALAETCQRFAELGLTPVVATELEFYLVDATSETPMPVSGLATGRRLEGDSVYGLEDLDQFEAFISSLYEICEAWGIPADSAVSENGGGQFEINLRHRDDAIAAADDAVLFKHAVRGAARSHGLTATFMAKPFPGRSGNGMHVHASLLDREGANVFDDGGPEGTARLRHAVAGLLDAMRGSTLVFAPHLNSFRRLQPRSHAPVSAIWGRETRHAAVRIPGGNPVARRIEHRVAGADANPYLVVASILGAMADGLERGAEPPAPVEGLPQPGSPTLPQTWSEALDAFASVPAAERLLPSVLVERFIGMKRQEMEVFMNRIGRFEYRSYLEVV